jgi:hypothetical protein
VVPAAARERGDRLDRRLPLRRRRPAAGAVARRRARAIPCKGGGWHAALRRRRFPGAVGADRGAAPARVAGVGAAAAVAAGARLPRLPAAAACRGRSHSRPRHRPPWPGTARSWRRTRSAPDSDTPRFESGRSSAFAAGSPAANPPLCPTVVVSARRRACLPRATLPLPPTDPASLLAEKSGVDHARLPHRLLYRHWRAAEGVTCNPRPNGKRSCCRRS